MFTAIRATPAHRAAPAAFHYRRRAGTRVLRDNLNIDLVFPIRDEISAWLMCLKAELLYDAGIINDYELDAVIERVAAAIGLPEKLTKEPPPASNAISTATSDAGLTSSNGTNATPIAIA